MTGEQFDALPDAEKERIYRGHAKRDTPAYPTASRLNPSGGGCHLSGDESRERRKDAFQNPGDHAASSRIA
jgi:hypothetical protein